MNANQNYIEVPSLSIRMAILKKQRQQMPMRMGGGEEPLYTVSGNVNE
jgi:hypothetical protein